MNLRAAKFALTILKIIGQYPVALALYDGFSAVRTIGVFRVTAGHIADIHVFHTRFQGNIMRFFQS